jgi:hypothetical protein
MAGKECGATQRSCPLRGYATSFESLPAPVPYLSRCCRELVGVHGPPDSAAFRAPPHRRDFTAGRFWFGSADVVAHRNRMVPGRTCFEDSPNPRTEERRVRGRRGTCRRPPPSQAAQEASAALRPLWSRPSRLSLAPGPTELRRTERDPRMLEGPPSLLRRGEVLWGLIPWQLQRSNRKQRRPQPTAVMHVLLIGKTWLPAAVCVGVEDQALELRARG